LGFGPQRWETPFLVQLIYPTRQRKSTYFRLGFAPASLEMMIYQFVFRTPADSGKAAQPGNPFQRSWPVKQSFLMD
jgi:hypothetical protein